MAMKAFFARKGALLQGLHVDCSIHFRVVSACWEPLYQAQSRGIAEASDSSFLQLPGTKVPFTDTLALVGGDDTDTSRHIPAFRVLSAKGKLRPGCEAFGVAKDLALQIYRCMVTVQIADTIFYEAQRQGRFSFYMTSTGEEASVVGSAAAFETGDPVFSQYREQAAFLWRGFTLREMADQCMGNEHDTGKGRQMPIHYGSRRLNMYSISSPLGTQLPQAVGAAYALKMRKAPNVAVAYFGEGCSSEGDFHAALNFAATLRCPVVFVCRNNGYAISTPASEQYRGVGIAERGPAYGMPAVRVDGGDALAVYHAAKLARATALERNTPVLVECMSYRIGHHSTSDDSSRYRDAGEMASWRAKDPVSRFGAWINGEGLWSEEDEKMLRSSLRSEAVRALDEAGKASKHPSSELFTDVYHTLPSHLREQQQEVQDYLARHPEALPPGVPH